MSGSFGEMGNLLKQAQRMQAAMNEAREDLGSQEFEGRAGGGMVGVSVTGNGEVRAVNIREEALKAQDVSLLEEMVLAAVRDGLNQANRAREERMAKVTGGLNLPGMM